MLVLLVFAVAKRSNRIASLLVLYAFAYLALGVLQNQRAALVAEELALSRGHTPVNLGLKPSFANIVVWKSVYEYQGRYYIDAIRILGSSTVYQGVSVDKLDLARHFPWLSMRSQQAKDVERFRWFSNGHLALDPENSERIIDVRYSLIPNQVTGMWGITLKSSRDSNEHVDWTSNRPVGQAAINKTTELLDMVFGR